jgi:hypothetical protein
MPKRWRDAISRLREQEVKFDPDTSRSRDMQISAAARELQEFLRSDEGRLALALLKAAKRHIIFGEEREDGYAQVAFIDGGGIQRSIEPGGESWAYHRGEIPKPIISPITAHAAVEAAVCFTKKKPNEVVPWLLGELDKIADAIK